MATGGSITILSRINSSDDLKNLSSEELIVLANEIRKKIINVVGKNGGHLASNLGVVELTIALHRVFQSPKDAIIFDVSHQCYAHKILTGRLTRFNTIRKRGGLSGFTRSSESEHDYFDSGHASTSISSALGLLVSREMLHKDGKVIAVIGDGALTGGEAFEGLCNAGFIGKNLIVVLNDNKMSISANEGTISRYLSRLTMTLPYQSFRYKVDALISKIKIPFLNRFLSKLIYRIKRALKGMFLSNNLFVDMGFEYVGPLDGHDIKSMETIFKRVRNLKKPVVVHVVTKKGKGYSPAENDPELFHGIGPFCMSDGHVEKYDTLSFTEAFSNKIVDMAEKNNKIVTITAAMEKGTGLSSFAHKFPERFFDVGIAEEHAITFAGGLSKGGLLPFVCIYSTFIQRAVDQIIQDLALPSLHAVIMLDRCGAVPDDGETHQGIFDIALLKNIPNITFLSPASKIELELFMEYSSLNNGVFIIRYPKESCPTELSPFLTPITRAQGILVHASDYAPTIELDFEDKIGYKKVLVACTGGIFPEVLVASRSLLLKGIYAEIYNIRFIKPFNFNYFYSIAKEYDAVVMVEDGVLSGGIGNEIKSMLVEKGRILCSALGFIDKFPLQGSRSEILENTYLSSQSIEAEALGLLNKVDL